MKKHTKIASSDIMLGYIADAFEKYGAEAAAAHDGLLGEAFEAGCYYFMTGHILKHCKTAGKVDIRTSAFTEGPKPENTEVKSSTGEIEALWETRTKWIIYCPIVDPFKNVEEQAHVFDHDEWLDFCNSYPGRGQFLRYDKKRGHWHIQSFYGSETVRPKASKAIRKYIDDYLEMVPTLAEFYEG